MAASITYLGSYSMKVHQITLSATSVEGISHSLPTAPDRYWSVIIGQAGNTSLAGTIAITAVGATTISFANTSGEALNGVAFFEVAHSLTK